MTGSPNDAETDHAALQLERIRTLAQVFREIPFGNEPSQSRHSDFGTRRLLGLDECAELCRRYGFNDAGVRVDRLRGAHDEQDGQPAQFTYDEANELIRRLKGGRIGS